MKKIVYFAVVLLAVMMLSSVSFSESSTVTSVTLLNEFENTTSSTYGDVGVSEIGIILDTADYTYHTEYAVLQYGSGNRVRSYRVESIIESVTSGLLTRSVSIHTRGAIRTREYEYSGSSWVLVSSSVIPVTTPVVAEITPVSLLLMASSYAPGDTYVAEILLDGPGAVGEDESCTVCVVVSISEVAAGRPSSMPIQEIESQIDLSATIISSFVYEVI